MAVADSDGGRPKLVVLRALGLGDAVTAAPALRALARAFPSHRRLLAAPRALAPIVRLVDAGSGEPAVHKVVHTAGLEPLDVSLGDADVAVNLHGRGPESHRLLLATRPRRLIAFEHAAVPRSSGGAFWRAREHEVRRWCRLLCESGIPADPAELDLRRPPAGPPPAAIGATVIHPGAASPARRWPPERWTVVARRELALGRRLIFTGTDAEVPLARSVARAAGAPENAVLAGRTDLESLAAIVAAAGRVVCGDTGVAHLATAFRRPSVVLFGPTAPDAWGPPPNRPSQRALWAGRAGDPHGRVVDPGLLEISPEQVIDALTAIERESAGAEAGSLAAHG